MTRRNNLDRCLACRMHATLCICALIPRLTPRTRVALLVHNREAHKPTNTGQLAARCLERSTVTIVGERDRPLDLPPVGDHELPLVLFPADDALPIASYRTADRPIVLFVPDGTWRQASKLPRRIAALAALPRVTVPDTGPTTYQLRSALREGGLATFEAIARALSVLEGDAGPAIEQAMIAVFRIMVDRTLWLRGALPDRAVTGGIPPAAVACDPRSNRATRSTDTPE
jgi:DTW domain-containing protein YfiP